MLKLMYDVKCGFKELYVTEKDRYIDLAMIIEANKDALEEEILEEEAEDFKAGNPITEEDFYELFKDNIEGLIEYLENNGQLECEEEFTIEEFGHTYLAAVCKEENCLPGYYEADNYRLVYEPNVKSDFYFMNAVTAKEVFDFLNVNKQQLHYYVKTGKIRREYNNDATEIRYNKSDVYKLYNEQLNKKAKIFAEKSGCSLKEASSYLMWSKNKRTTTGYALINLLAELVNQSFHDIIDSNKSAEAVFNLFSGLFRARLENDEYISSLDTALKMLENLLEAKLPENIYYSYKDEFDILLSEEKLRFKVWRELNDQDYVPDSIKDLENKNK